MGRRLAAILAADVVGYSRLMGKDETGTLEALRSHREELIEPKIAEHEGRIVKLMGDGMLAEFPSAVEAVQCAVEIQHAASKRNAEVPSGKKITYRMGINIGDVIIENEDIYGGGVNIAFRLESMAEPGNVCVARNVYNQVKAKVEVDFEDLGEQELKNVAEPVRLYRIIGNHSGDDSASGARQALSLPDKPSIAVLPFDNMSGDPEQEYFADGMTEDIITALSRLRWLFVIARNSSFFYKGTAIDIKRVGRELGVRYVLEGSVRKSGQRVRVSVQLIEAETGKHIWAERYDRELADIFDLQDELTEAISAQDDAELAGSEREQAHRKATTDLNASPGFGPRIRLIG